MMEFDDCGVFLSKKSFMLWWLGSEVQYGQKNPCYIRLDENWTILWRTAGYSTKCSVEVVRTM